MAWTSPMTFTASTVLTAAQLNTHLRDNLNETAPAKATAAGGIFVGTAANAIAQRVPFTDSVATTETTGSTTYTDLATTGPTLSLTTCARAIVFTTARIANNTSGQTAFASYGVTGASAISADDQRAIWLLTAAANQEARMGGIYFETGLTPGTNTFTMKYKVSANTGSFQHRRITVFPL